MLFGSIANRWEMSPSMPSVRHPHRWSNPVAALLLLGVGGAVAANAHADPADFQAMPGLWKITVHTLKDGRASVHWHCLFDGGDPWEAFAELPLPDGCRRGGERRTSTALAWQVSCAGATPHVGNGRVVLDSPEHYTGDLTLDGHTALRVEGRRYAACTSPSD